MTVKQAKKLGYEIQEGDYLGTSDNRANRWYIIRDDDDILDKRGIGFASKKEALQEIEDRLNR